MPNTAPFAASGLPPGLAQLEYTLLTPDTTTALGWTAIAAAQFPGLDAYGMASYAVMLPQPAGFTAGYVQFRQPGQVGAQTDQAAVAFPAAVAPLPPTASPAPGALPASTGSGVDDLLVYCRLLLVGDAPLQALFAANLDPAALAATLAVGEPAVAVVDPENRALAAYPRIVLSGEEGEQASYGDPMPKFYDGRLRLEVVTRQSDACPSPLSALTAIKGRCQALLGGDPTQGLPGVRGQRVSPVWQVSAFHQVRPTGRLPVTDPEFKRHLTTYAALLNRATL